MDFVAIAKMFSDRPEIALIILMIGLIIYGLQKLLNAGFTLVGEHLKNIDDNFRSVAKDLGGLRVDVAKVAERLEAREEVVEAKFTDLDRRVTRLEDRGEKVQ
jgi:flagellar capping protein FliD